jgi:ABC-type sugar transport system substrate-binding protein
MTDPKQRSAVNRMTLLMIALVVALAVPVAATAAPPQASVIAVSYKAPNPFLDVVVAIPKRIDSAARKRNVDWGLQVTVVYTSQNGTVETLDSGRLSVKNDTIFVARIDKHTDLVSLQLPLGTAPPPGVNPGFSGTAQLLPPPTGGDDGGGDDD